MKNTIYNSTKYIKIQKITDPSIAKISLTLRQKNLIENLLIEIGVLQEKLEVSLAIDDVLNNIFNLPLLWLEGESSSIIEGTRTRFEDFIYDYEEINNIPQWETRNLINLYKKYLYEQPNYALKTFRCHSEGIKMLHIALYENDKNSKFKITMDLEQFLNKTKPGIINFDDNKPNWYGPSQNKKDAQLVFLKPSLKEEYLSDLMGYIEKQKNKQELQIDDIAKMHPIFEAVHPFANGNGRIGRLLLSMMFVWWKPKIKISINMSEVFKNNQEEYITLMRNVQLNNDCTSWNKWNAFFVKTVIETKQNVQKRIYSIIKIWTLYSQNKKISTPVRKEILKLFFKYYKINRNKTINKLRNQFPKKTKQTLYNDFKIVSALLKIKTDDNNYFYFKKLELILRAKIR